jgi:2-methylcitrate dehydratase PrpD
VISATVYAPDLSAFTEFAAALRFEDIPSEVLERGRTILLDCIGCIVAGQRATEMDALVRIEAARGQGPATVIGRKLGLPREAAAFLNGTAGTWHDLDEGNLHTKGHPGIQILPAAFAEAETKNNSGAELLLSLIAGYEVGCRVYGATAARLAVHPHGTFGPLAAAVALAKLRHLATDRMAQAIAVAATLGIAASRGTLQDGATVRNAYTGLSGRMAFLALDLEGAGFSGERDALASVFGKIYGEEYDPGRAVEGLGRDWLILRNYFKLHASGRYVHSALDLIDALRLEHRAALEASAIERIDIETYAMAATMARQSVDTPFGTRFSIPFAVAAHLLGYDQDITADGSAAFAAPAVRALAQRVWVAELAEFSAAYPRRQPSRMRIRLADGRTLTAQAEIIKGEPERPHSQREIDDKFLTLVGPSWRGRGEEALALLREIDRVPGVQGLGKRFRDMAEGAEQ